MRQAYITQHAVEDLHAGLVRHIHFHMNRAKSVSVPMCDAFIYVLRRRRTQYHIALRAVDNLTTKKLLI